MAEQPSSTGAGWAPRTGAITADKAAISRAAAKPNDFMRAEQAVAHLKEEYPYLVVALET